jgi:hypothetical protein
MQTLMLHYLKELLAPFCLSSKRYQIPFCNLPKGIDTGFKIQKVCENKRVLHAEVELLPVACQRVTDCL